MVGFVDFGLGMRLLSVRRSVSEEFGQGYTVIGVIRNECRGFNNLSYTVHFR